MREKCTETGGKFKRNLHRENVTAIGLRWANEPLLLQIMRIFRRIREENVVERIRKTLTRRKNASIAFEY